MTPTEIKSQFYKKTNSSKIKVEENGKQAVFLNPNRSAYFVIRVDGHLIKNKVACDFVVSKEEFADLMIELKGMDVDHAVEQVLSTAKFWHDTALREGKIAALVVSSRYPRFDSKVARYKEKFARQFKGPLHLVTKNQEYCMERVVEFNGPL
ncbi:hypothetical protein [Undibacterium fentianense]|uniref:Uncharacterized protein n=1 Tax=Undibacterium fentianense TaxID=2828728 RepID=A0A941E680_9BURK|nr:hypothetical protein [Undibacterium fentianense]MBR7800503.1 hypothetical protein [Undibacterium fentianense]